MPILDISQLHQRRGLVVTGIITMFSASALMVGIMLWNNASPADISDALGGPQASPDGSLAGPVVRIPQPITDVPANSLVAGPRGEVVRYYESQTGRAFQFDLPTHKASVLSDHKLAGFVRTLWSSGGDQVVSVFTNPTGTAWKTYNYQTGVSAALGTSVISAAFSPDGQNIAFLETDQDVTKLFIAHADGSEPRHVFDTRAVNTEISWPSANTLALVSRRVDQSGKDLSLIGTDGSLVSLLSNRENLEYRWSRGGSVLLYSYFKEGSGVQLWTYDIGTGQTTGLGVATGANKCAWTPGDGSLICGVPTNTALSKDVSSGKSATLDDIVVVNRFSGTQRQVYAATHDVYLGVIDPVISQSSTYFVFTNLFDQRLYSIEI